MFRTFMLSAAIAVPAAALAVPTPAPTPAPTYVMKAGAGDLYELQSSKLVLGSANPKVKGFAQMMVTDHSKSTADVKAAATKAGLTPKPPMLSAKQSTMIANLTKVSGAARDQMYVEQQKAAHNEALALHEDYGANGTAAPLKAVATKIVPVVKTHIQMLAAM